MLKTASRYYELTKPRIAAMVLVMTAFGFFLASGGIHSLSLFLFTLLGTALAGSGASALNQYLERDVDARMERTKNRPIPTGDISPQAALFFGVMLVMGGCFVLLFKVNVLAAFLTLQSTFLYVLVYTPMKRLSWLNTAVGAIPGAMPPLIGCAGATGTLDMGAWALFLILYLWQHPHFFAIAWMYRDDYARAGLKMLPVVQPDGQNMFAQVIIFSIVLIPASLLPTLIGMSGWLYLAGAAILSLAFFVVGAAFSLTRTQRAARRELLASVVYLPMLLILIIIDALVVA